MVALSADEQIKKLYNEILASDEIRLSKQSDDANDLELINDIAYIDDDNPYHLLDIYYPKGAIQPLPVIIDIHGGCLIYGTKDLNKYSNYEVARRGFAVISISYRLIPEVTLKEQIQDVFDAYNYISKLSDKYPLDLSNCFVMGDSAGGLLTFVTNALLRNDKLRKQMNLPQIELQPKAIGLISPMTETVKDSFGDMLKPYICIEDDSLDFLYSPLKVIDVKESLPPCWLLTSEEDFLRKETLAIKNVFDKLGMQNVFLDIPIGQNGYPLEHVFQISYPHYPESQKVIDNLCTFFKNIIS